MISFERFSKEAEACLFMVRAYYLVILGIINQMLLVQIRAEGFGNRLIPTVFVSWIHSVGLDLGYLLITLGAFAILLVTALFVHLQSLRILSAIFIFQIAALFNSFGGSSHLFQFWLWSSVAMAIVPTFSDRLTSYKDKHLVRMIIYFGQIATLTMYSLSGMWKLIGAVQQLTIGEPTIFSGVGLPTHIASEILRANASPILAEWISDKPMLCSLGAIGVVFVQFFSLGAAFFPRFIRFWGVFLILFHLGTNLILSITYPTNVFLIAVLLVASPFKSSRFKFVNVAALRLRPDEGR